MAEQSSTYASFGSAAEDFNAVIIQANSVRQQWSNIPVSCTDAAAVAAVEASVLELCRLLDLSCRCVGNKQASASLEVPADGPSAVAPLDKAEWWSTLIEVAETASHVPGSSLPHHILSVLHTITIAEVGLHRTGMAVTEAASEPGYLVELLCDYLDLILVPTALRRPSLREDAVRCPCGRCLGAAQALQRLQHSNTLRAALQASVLPLLCGLVERSAGIAATSDESRDDGIRAAECLALFATCARLQDGLQCKIPQRTMSAISSLMHVVPPFPSSGSMLCGSSPEGGWNGPSLLGVLHVLRNVASNSAEVLENSSGALAAYGRQVWSSIEVLAREASSPSRRPGTGGPRRRPTLANDKVIGGGSMPVDEDSPREPSASSQATSGHGDSHQKPVGIIASSSDVAVAQVPAAACESGNPQESDEYTSGAEVGPASVGLLETSVAKQATVESQEVIERETSRQRSESPEGSSSSSIADSSEPQKRCAEMIALFSLTLQALYQTDEALQQPEVFASEDAVRWQLIALTQPLRGAGPPLLQKWRERLAFHGLRLYLLISRSSHKRRQYVVLQPQFVESERRNVAFMLSLTPPSQRCCVLLRAMAQDVNSWLSWQAQAPPTMSTMRTVRPASTAYTGLPARQRRSRPAQSEGNTSSASKARIRSPKHHISGSSRKNRTVSVEGSSSASGAMFGRESADLARLFSAESGEAVWLVHAVLLLAFVLSLLAIWHSLEHPRGPSLGSSWRFEF